jgi:hypothetical protein
MQPLATFFLFALPAASHPCAGLSRLPVRGHPFGSIGAFTVLKSLTKKPFALARNSYTPVTISD